MNLTIKLDRETDGRWIAEVPELNVLIYGAGRDEAIRKAEAAAMEIIAERIRRPAISSAPPSSSAPA